jgi:hypothetical protein
MKIKKIITESFNETINGFKVDLNKMERFKDKLNILNNRRN